MLEANALQRCPMTVSGLPNTYVESGWGIRDHTICAVAGATVVTYSGTWFESTYLV